MNKIKSKCNNCNKQKELIKVTYFNPYCIYSNPYRMLCVSCKNEKKPFKNWGKF